MTPDEARFFLTGILAGHPCEDRALLALAVITGPDPASPLRAEYDLRLLRELAVRLGIAEADIAHAIGRTVPSAPNPAADYEPEKENTFEELGRIWAHHGYSPIVSDLRVVMVDGVVLCECCGHVNQAWPLRCPLCEGEIRGSTCEKCDSRGPQAPVSMRTGRLFLLWSAIEGGPEFRREWRERPHVQW